MAPCFALAASSIKSAAKKRLKERNQNRKQREKKVCGQGRNKTAQPVLPSHQLSQAAAINEGENEPVLCPFVLVLRRKERMKAKKKGKGLLREKKENKEKKI
jgi:hypothetical protein